MLSGETSVGEYPVTVVETMARIVASTEDHGLERIPPLGTKPRTQGGAITLAAVEVADFVDAKYLCVFTESGDSARRMSRLRHPDPDHLVHRSARHARSRNALIWGVETFLVARGRDTDELMGIDRRHAPAENGLAEVGDRRRRDAGRPAGIAGSTNNVRVHTIGAIDGA